MGGMAGMTMGYKVFLNCIRNDILTMPPALRKTAAMKEAKMFVVSKALKRGMFDESIPDILVSEEMAERFLEISPPVYSLIMPDYQSIANEIEQSYVTGNDFSALSASCVVIERLLNQARVALHEHHKKDKKLWGKGSKNEWGPNIEALKEWGYLDKPFASELSEIYTDIRCRYLHSGEIRNMRQDTLRAITAAYRLMKVFIGFPEDLFDGVTCRNELDPRYLVFYKPYLQDMELAEVSERYAELDRLRPKNYAVSNNWGSALTLLARLRGDAELFRQACAKFEQAVQLVSVESEKCDVYCNWGVALAEWAKLEGNQELFVQASQKFEQAVKINHGGFAAYDKWSGTLIHWSKLKIGTPEHDDLLEQAEEKSLQAESLRKGSSAYRLAKIYASRNNEERCRVWLLVGQEARTLPTRQQATGDSDLDSVRNERWFEEVRWGGEKQ
jgi:hypothetical protein